MKSEPQPRNDSGKDPAGIKSVEKAALLLQALSETRHPMRAVDLAAAAGMTRSMVRAYLVSLTRVGLLRQDPDTGRYDFGPVASAIGFAALARMDFLSLARGALRELSERTGETVLLATWNVNGPVIVAKMDGHRAVVYDIRIGSHVSLETTSTGRIFLSYLPQSTWKPLLGKVYGYRDPATVTAPSEEDLQNIISMTRKDGLAVSESSPTLPGFGGISAPVFDREGHLQGAITMVIPTGGRDRDALTRLVQEVKDTADALSSQLGYQAVKDAG